MTLHREQNMKREDQQDATIRCLLLTSVSTCFGHHYAHHQENKGPATAFGVSLCNKRENLHTSKHPLPMQETGKHTRQIPVKRHDTHLHITFANTHEFPN